MHTPPEASLSGFVIGFESQGFMGHVRVMSLGMDGTMSGYQCLVCAYVDHVIGHSISENQKKKKKKTRKGGK